MDVAHYISADTWTIVRYVMAGLAALYLIMEVLLNLNEVDNDTSNVILLEWSKGKLIFIPFALGAIGGHLFLGTTNPAFRFSESMYAVLLLAILCGIGWWLGHRLRFERTPLFHTALLLAGLLYGHLFWSMDNAPGS